MTAALECYLSSILEIAETIAEISPEIAPAFCKQLMSLRSGLAAGATPEQLEESRLELHQILKRFCDQARVHLQEAELLAALDPLTGVANRRDLDRELAARIEAGHEFCLLLFDLNGFKEINDRFGHLYGDEVLKQLAARLSSQVRAHDYICRWGGDEFVAILACDLAVAETRARQIAQRLNGAYHIRGPERELQVDITATVGLVQYCNGESPAQLFRRVDEAMYRQKQSSPAG
jgi:diguanylate cyclase (GGDEF)-like protein